MPLSLPSTEPKPLGAGLYRTDAFHRQPLFVVDVDQSYRGQAAQVVGSWGEAHALHGPAQVRDVNPAYVAALISGSHSAEAAPYQRIRRMPRAHHVLVASDGTVQTSAYDPLAGGAAAMEAEALHQFLRQGLLDHVQQALRGHPGAIGCEHSSGLDSNAVLGALVHGVGVSPERLHTLSDEGGGEGLVLEQLRPFHHLLPEQCHRWSPSEPQVDGVELLDQHLRVFGAPAQVGGDPMPASLLSQKGCTVLFSGYGGDQALSHNAANVPTDLVAQGRWRELIQWTGGRRSALKIAGGRTLAILYRPWAVSKVLRRTRDSCRSNLLERSLTAHGQAWLAPHLKDQYPWEIDDYVTQHRSIRQRVLADFLAVRAEAETRVAATYGIDKVFPLLDERLIATLLNQNPSLFGEGTGRGRLLHRLGFAPFLPPFLRDNPTKYREPEVGWESYYGDLVTKQRQVLEVSLAASSNWHPELAVLWDLAAIRQETETILANSDAALKEVMGISIALATMTSLSHWWQALEG